MRLPQAPKLLLQAQLLQLRQQPPPHCPFAAFPLFPVVKAGVGAANSEGGADDCGLTPGKQDQLASGTSSRLHRMGKYCSMFPVAT